MSKIVICASGEGALFEGIVEAARRKTLRADVVGLIVNRGKIGALGRAERLGVPNCVLSRKDFVSPADWDVAMLEQLRLWQADWVVLAGFLALVGPQVLRNYPGRVINIHPSLLPRYGGPGMFGERVHAAVLAAGEVETGITVHRVNEEFDRGEIIQQRRLPILPDDTPASLSARVKAEEVRFYPEVLNTLVARRDG